MASVKSPSSDNGSHNLENEEAQKLLQKLDSLKPPPELVKSVEQLAEDYKRIPKDTAHLVQHLKVLIKIYTPKPEHNSEEKTNSDGSSWLGSFFGSTSREKKKVKVHSIVTAETFGADHEILKDLNKDFELIHKSPADCDVVLIFCVILSRVGSDVKEAMGRIPEAAGDKPVILVVMFHTSKENDATDGTQWIRDMYKNVVLSVEVLFHKSKHGLLSCGRNKHAIKHLVDGFEKYESTQ